MPHANRSRLLGRRHIERSAMPVVVLLLLLPLLLPLLFLLLLLLTPKSRALLLASQRFGLHLLQSIAIAFDAVWLV
jgi:hypothetical protein